MLKLALAVVAIALADCVNPSLIGGELFVATGEHPARQTIAFAAAALVVTFVVGFALAVGLGDLILSLVPKPGHTVKYVLIVLAGIVLVCGGAVVWIRRRALVSTGESDETTAPPARGADGGRHRRTGTAHRLSLLRRHRADRRLGRVDVGKLSLLVLYCVIYVSAHRDRPRDHDHGAARRAHPSAGGRLAVGPLAGDRCTAHGRIRDRRSAFGIVQLAST